ncbi:hypothetical protein K2Y11_01740 [bacterium]|nr:hypothetical protein [bacterium]
MLYPILWSISSIAVFALAYSLGYEAGREDGIQKGFQGALKRAIQSERPLDLLRRVLVPRRDA